MRLELKTDGIQFRVAGPAKAEAGLQGQGAAGDHAGRRADLDRPPGRDRARARGTETIWVEVAGEQPRLTFDGYAVVRGLVFAPWVGRDGKIRRAFRAESVEPSQSGKSVQAA